MLWPRLARTLFRRPLTDPAAPPAEETVSALAARLDATARARLGRSLSIRQVDAGSCNGCELEIAALQNVVYDLERFGLRFVASPRHADVLLVTGPMARNMSEAVQRAHACMPEPGWVVAVGDCALDGGVFAGSYAVEGGTAAVLPVDLLIPGCPPSPALLLEGLLTLLEAEARPAPPPAPPAPAPVEREEAPDLGWVSPASYPRPATGEAPATGVAAAGIAAAGGAAEASGAEEVPPAAMVGEEDAPPDGLSTGEPPARPVPPEAAPSPALEEEETPWDDVLSWDEKAWDEKAGGEGGGDGPMAGDGRLEGQQGGGVGAESPPGPSRPAGPPPAAPE